MATDLICVHTTTDTRDSALALARALVERQLGACVQISAIDSVYRWEGELQLAGEFRLLVKTSRALYPQVQALIADLHPYDLPAIWAVGIEQASEDYAQWVRENCSPA